MNQVGTALDVARDCRRLTAQKAFAAIHRPTLGGFEWNRGLPPALRACGHGFGLRESRARRALALGLAVLTALGFILEVLVVEEVLFSRCENEVCPAVNTLEDSILEIRHGTCAPLTT